LSGGLGVGTGDYSVGAAFSYAHLQHLVTLRSAATAELFEDGYWDYAVLYGRSWRRGERVASLAAGIGVVDGEACRGVFGTCTNTAPVVGLYGFAVINQLKSFAGLLAVIQVGRLR
jgi:hypothetical protein